jgi:hypothetical protein
MEYFPFGDMLQFTAGLLVVVFLARPVWSRVRLYFTPHCPKCECEGIYSHEATLNSPKGLVRIETRFCPLHGDFKVSL